MDMTCRGNVYIHLSVEGGSALAALDLHAAGETSQPAGGSVAQPATLWLRAARQLRFFWDDPHVYYRHVHGMGKAADLSRHVKPGLDLIGRVKPEAAAPAIAGGTPLDTAKLTKIVGHEGEQSGAVYKITVGRDDLGAFTHNLFFLLVAGTIGVISPSGNECPDRVRVRR